MTISGERTEQLDIFCHVNDFTSDFLSFIDVELIRFFHGALQLCTMITLLFLPVTYMYIKNAFGDIIFTCVFNRLNTQRTADHVILF